MGEKRTKKGGAHHRIEEMQSKTSAGTRLFGQTNLAESEIGRPIPPP